MFCEHNSKRRLEGLCKECADKKPYLVFRYCKKQCFACNECGYFWGPGHDKLDGQPVRFSPDGS